MAAESSTRRCVNVRVTSFNEAAAKWPRKGVADVKSALEGARFNEAAAKWPPKASHGRSTA
jgi:hypothetical protein